MRRNSELIVWGGVGVFIFLLCSLWWFFTMVPIHEERMYVNFRNWQLQINYIHKWTTEDCDWEDEDDDGDTEWVCDTDTHHETLKTWSRSGVDKDKVLWPETPTDLRLDSNYYLKHHQNYYINFRSNKKNQTFVWTVGDVGTYQAYPLETVALVKLNRLNKIIFVEKWRR